MKWMEFREKYFLFHAYTLKSFIPFFYLSFILR